MQEKFLTTIATEALKPVSSVIDALLQPTLRRIRTRAKKKELRERLQDPIINELLNKYFKRLLKRASGITTIAFPQQVLPLTSIYEPLYLKQKPLRWYYGTKDLHNHILFAARDLQPEQNYLIIDSAGMGKSTLVKHLVLDIFQSTIKIPLFLELRRIGDSETLLGSLAREIDETQDDIDEEFLAVLLDQGGYAIILDGYDELSEKAREKIGLQISQLALGHNTLIITSRPEVNIPEIPYSEVYSIEPLERKQAESLILRYDAVANLDIGKGLLDEFDNISNELFETPLLVVILYRAYSYNQSITTKVTSYYDDVYNAFYKGHDLTKSGFSRTKVSGLDAENFRRLLRAFSFLLLIEDKYILKSDTEAYAIIERAAKTTSITLSSATAFFKDLLLSVPFLIRDGNEFHFIHRSLGDFFAAEYLASASDAEKKIELIQGSTISRRFKQSFDFLAELDPSLYRRSILAPIAKTYLSMKGFSENPELRTLWCLGITYIGITTDPESDHKDWAHRVSRIMEYKVESPIFSVALFMKGSFSTSHINGLELLSQKKQFEQVVGEWSEQVPEQKKQYRNELLSIQGLHRLTDEAVLSISSNPILQHVLHITLVRLTGNSEDGSSRVFDEEACKNILETIHKESEARKQIDAIISSHN